LEARLARINLTLPDPLYERLERFRDRVNVSKVCALALTKELDMIEGTAAVKAPYDLPSRYKVIVPASATAATWSSRSSWPRSGMRRR